MRSARWSGIAGSLDAKPLSARLFYGTIAVTTLAGALLNFAGIDPARALYWAAVVNGVLAAPLMAMMMLIVTNPRAMGRVRISRAQRSAAGCDRGDGQGHGDILPDRPLGRRRRDYRRRERIAWLRAGRSASPPRR